MKTKATRRIIRPLEERGQALVEFAVILPVIILILMGIVDLGRVFNAYVTIANAAREGARYGIVYGHSTDDAGIRNQVVTEALPAVQIVNDASHIVITDSGSRNPGSELSVRVNYDFNAVTPLISSFWGGGALTIHASSTMVIE